MMDKGKTHRSIKIEITQYLDESQRCDIDNTIADSSIVFDLFAKLGCEHKSTSYMRMHSLGYEIAKQKCPDLNTGLLQGIAKSALRCVKAWNTKNKKQKWMYKGYKQSQSYPLNKLTLSKRGELYTFSTNGKRIRLILNLPEWFDSKYPDRKLCSGIVQKNKNRYLLNLTFEVPCEVLREGKIVGIDRGLYNIIASSEGELISSKHLHTIERRYQYMRSQLQSKGTRSARKHLKKMSGREMRFKMDVDHCISKALASKDDVSCYVLEDLSGIGKSNRGRKLNRWIHKWSTYRFQTFLEYKCDKNGIDVQYVSPAYTSQTCNVCGNIDKSARVRSRYLCSCCGHIEHADINASKNIRIRYLLSLEGESGRIQPSECSDIGQGQSHSLVL